MEKIMVEKILLNEISKNNKIVKSLKKTNYCNSNNLYAKYLHNKYSKLKNNCDNIIRLLSK